MIVDVVSANIRDSRCIRMALSRHRIPAYEPALVERSSTSRIQPYNHLSTDPRPLPTLLPLVVVGNNLIPDPDPLTAPFTPDDIDALFQLTYGDPVLAAASARMGVVAFPLARAVVVVVECFPRRRRGGRVECEFFERDGACWVTLSF